MVRRQVESRRASTTRRPWGWGSLVPGIGMIVVFGGCSWVDVSEEAQVVTVRKSLDEVAGCEARGKVSARTTASVGFISRNETKVALELERLARNDAVGLGANVIVPLEPVTAEGTRRYSAFHCAEEDY